jgi:hypothetical protein
MDEHRLVGEGTRSHTASCPRCQAFLSRAWRIRELTRFEVAPAVTDLVPQIMALVRTEAQTAPASRRLVKRGFPPARRVWRLAGPPRAPRRRVVNHAWVPVAAAALVGFIVGAAVTAGVLPRSAPIPTALAAEIPSKLLGAARALSGYRAAFEITELDWTRAVPKRTFVADVWFRAPEAFRVRVRDTTAYPSAAWPRNDLQLVTDGQSWRESGPSPCPRQALPVCPSTGPRTRTVTGRAPFDPSTILPTDVIVPMTVLAASDRVDVVGSGRVAGRDSVAVGMAYRDATPLFQYLQFLGSWRPFFPDDRVVLWLDRETWFPLRYEVFPAPGSERALWASQAGLPRESSDRSVFSATARSLDTERMPASSSFRVPGSAHAPSEGFSDRPEPSMRRPRWTDGLPRWRSGAFVGSGRGGGSMRRSVLAFADGLSWITVTRVTGWTGRMPFGVGAFAEPVRLRNGAGLYEAASATDPRRVFIHTRMDEWLVATNLPRAALLRSAGSLPVTGMEIPSSWRVHRWADGVTRTGLSPEQVVASAGFPVQTPTDVPRGYGAVSAEIARVGSDRTLTLVYRRPAAELGGIGMVLTESSAGVLPPPQEAAVQAVAVGRTTARWSPQRHLLEWVDDGRYRSLSCLDLDLGTLVRVARSLREAHP